MRGFTHGREPDLTPDGYRMLITEAFGPDAPAVLAEYAGGDFDSPTLALAAVLGDWGGQIGACPVLATAAAAAEHQSVYTYEFAEDGGRTEDGFPLGAYHGLELPYLWTLNGYNPYPPLDPAQQHLSATMIDYWSAFARTGDVNGPGRPHWPEYSDSGTVVGLSTGGIGPTPAADRHRCGFWSGLAGSGR